MRNGDGTITVASVFKAVLPGIVIAVFAAGLSTWVLAKNSMSREDFLVATSKMREKYTEELEDLRIESALARQEREAIRAVLIRVEAKIDSLMENKR